MADELALLQHVADDAWDELKNELGRADVCIAATRLALEILAPLGYDVKPLPVRLFAYNAIWIQKALAAGHHPKSEQEGQQWQAEGAWAVGAGIGHRDDRDAPYGRNEAIGRFNGHLVLIVNRDYLLDLSLAQIARPERNIYAEQPLVVRLDSRAFLHGTRAFVARYQAADHDEVMLEYQAVPGDRTYRRTADWTHNSEAWKTIAERVRLRVTNATPIA